MIFGFWNGWPQIQPKPNKPIFGRMKNNDYFVIDFLDQKIEIYVRKNYPVIKDEK